ncbi:MAG: sulfite exporter TauE/SafE family protein [Thermoplasmata archaeon]
MSSVDTKGGAPSPLFSGISSKKVFISSEIVVITAIMALVTYYHLVLDGPLNLWIYAIPAIGFVLAMMDSSMGMGYGTIGTPFLIVLGFSSKLVVPSILLSQAVAALVASMLHQQQRNVNYFDLHGNDIGIVLRLIVFGVLGVIIAMLVEIQISKVLLNTYIGCLVISMGLLLLSRPRLTFSWLKVSILSLISGFNKAISGGGYGPVATTGLLVSGNPLKNSVGATLLSVTMINTTAFIGWALTKSFASLELPIFLVIGVLLGSQVGPSITKRASSLGAKVVFACLAIIMGAMTIISTFIK